LSTDPERRERSDRLRNRDRILAAAREAFSRADLEERSVSMNEIARAAGVGAATLYRHFPTRDDLATALYASKLEALNARVADRTRTADGALTLQTWVSEFAGFMLGTRSMMDTLRSTWQTGTRMETAATEQIAATLTGFVEQGARDRSLRPDLDPLDVTFGVLALLSTTPPGDSGERSRRLLTLFVDGLRAGAAD